MNLHNTIEGVVTLYGKNPGKTVTILAGVHGNEKFCAKAVDGILSCDHALA